MRIFRYLCREVAMTTIAIWFVLLIIMLISQSAVYLAAIARGSVAFSYFGKLILLNIPFLTAIMIPFAFYFGLLLSYGRLYADSEMVVLQASGFSQRRLFTYTAIITAVVFFFSAFLILYLNPKIINQKGKILMFSANNILQSLIPGEFKSINDGKTIIYVGNANHNKTKLKDIFVANLAHKGKTSFQDSWYISYAASAHQINRFNHSYLQNNNGYAYKGIPGDIDYAVMKYQSFAGLVQNDSISETYKRLDGTSTLRLWQMSSNLDALSELEWRISMVLAVLVLALLALPLSQVRPRQGRYAKFLPAILFCFVYLNLLFVARTMLENGSVSRVLGLWWVHVVMVICILLYYAKTYRWFVRGEG